MNHANDTADSIDQLFFGLMGSISHGVVALGASGIVSVVNQRAIELLGYGEGHQANDYLDEHYSSLFDKTPDISDMYQNLVLSGRRKEFDIPSLPNGPYELVVKCRSMMHGCLFLLEEKAGIHHGKNTANHDELTHLLNRKEFEQRLQKAFEQHQATNLESGVIFINIDHFKPVNDVAGHAAGDALLRRISTLIQSRIKPQDHAARMGGDEFCILIEDCPQHVCERVALSICDDIEKLSFHHDGRLFNVSASIGISTMSHEFSSSSEVLSAADAACRSAKLAGRNTVQILDKDHHLYNNAQNQSEWLDEINRSLTENRLLLARQKICSTSDHSLHHWEILVRMQGVGGRIISPGLFLPIAERYQLMPEIDRYVLGKVFEYCHVNGDDADHYAINLSAQTICQERFPAFVDALLEKYAIDTQRIMFEITESSALDNMETCLSTINYLRELGFEFALDDFGTGFSSFKNLQSIPVSYLKIDGAFVRGIESDDTLKAIVQSMQDIGAAMNLKTIAEFVETEAECRTLDQIGVDFVQGYYLHKPELIPIERYAESRNPMTSQAS
ncbi:diguanylate cyclase (GGDEF)-like protein [Litorivivens lipolytica]|uniref:Diguanylate cyclase (GGDEF)-like protein n=1 Tax=Litorivivens lipolytica TaxID=1524264 RepID=A0A7W4W4C6_9GAMM|nr:EAL domain-containing protein [Litorivivens lipolytica]MBB3047216.1 diguanylate cyclase (GGDEF)-like protein [Litorivivens lipolytica]